MRSGHQRLSEAFRLACTEAGVTQEALAAQAGVHQTTVSKWLTGKTPPPLYVLLIVDRLCGKRLGYVLRLAHLVEDDLDVRERIATDPKLDAGRREQMLAIYDIFRRDSSTEGGSQRLPEEPPSEREQAEGLANDFLRGDTGLYDDRDQPTDERHASDLKERTAAAAEHRYDLAHPNSTRPANESEREAG